MDTSFLEFKSSFSPLSNSLQFFCISNQALQLFIQRFRRSFGDIPSVNFFFLSFCGGVDNSFVPQVGSSSVLLKLSSVAMSKLDDSQETDFVSAPRLMFIFLSNLNLILICFSSS